MTVETPAPFAMDIYPAPRMQPLQCRQIQDNLNDATTELNNTNTHIFNTTSWLHTYFRVNTDVFIPETTKRREKRKLRPQNTP